MAGGSLAPVGAMRRGDHCCVRVGSDTEQRDVVAAYVRDGLARQDQVAYFCAGDPAVVVDFLAERGVAVGACMHSGQLRVVSPEQGYLAESVFDPDVMVAGLRQMVSDAHTLGYRTLRATGEVHALCGRPGGERLLEYERKATAVFTDGGALGLCLYDQREFSEDQLSAAEAAHPRRVGPNPLYRDALLSIVPTYSPTGVKMLGEIDITHTRPGDDRVLQALHDLTRDLHMDLSGLRFLDVAGARLLAQIAQHLDRHGALLVLRRPGRGVLSVLRLTGWNQLPNVVIDELGP